eukprot:m.143961 g.143961  ORF g.143961 m.143961 type:complete len:86 (+) comp24234_c0_seq1:1083-1340(+)
MCIFTTNIQRIHPPTHTHTQTHTHARAHAIHTHPQPNAHPLTSLQTCFSLAPMRRSFLEFCPVPSLQVEESVMQALNVWPFSLQI